MDDDELTIRICDLLAEIPEWAWKPNGPAYTAAEVGIFYGTILAAPDRAVGVRVYGGTDGDVAMRRVQLRFRGAKQSVNSADQLAGAAKRHLHMLARRSLISLAIRTSFSPLGADSNAREERADNYQIILDNPEAST